jgi:DNA polymerase III epsilon subunit-like protein
MAAKEQRTAPATKRPDRDLREVTFVVLDLETTGASPTVGAGITEIGAIKVKGYLPSLYEFLWRSRRKCISSA